MSDFGLIDDVINEPMGAAHTQPDVMAASIKKYIEKNLKELAKIDAEKRIENRINKFSKMGFYQDVEEA
jgi:acetyl-CoA carboxylase carboxyl transferase subunit alpha